MQGAKTVAFRSRLWVSDIDVNKVTLTILGQNNVLSLHGMGCKQDSAEKENDKNRRIILAGVVAHQALVPLPRIVEELIPTAYFLALTFRRGGQAPAFSSPRHNPGASAYRFIVHQLSRNDLKSCALGTLRFERL